MKRLLHHLLIRTYTCMYLPDKKILCSHHELTCAARLFFGVPPFTCHECASMQSSSAYVRLAWQNTIVSYARCAQHQGADNFRSLLSVHACRLQAFDAAFSHSHWSCSLLMPLCLQVWCAFGIWWRRLWYTKSRLTTLQYAQLLFIQRPNAWSVLQMMAPQKSGNLTQQCDAHKSVHAVHAKLMTQKWTFTSLLSDSGFASKASREARKCVQESERDCLLCH